jgi:hypothetical protein
LFHASSYCYENQPERSHTRDCVRHVGLPCFHFPNVMPHLEISLTRETQTGRSCHVEPLPVRNRPPTKNSPQRLLKSCCCFEVLARLDPVPVERGMHCLRLQCLVMAILRHIHYRTALGSALQKTSRTAGVLRAYANLHALHDFPVLSKVHELAQKRVRNQHCRRHLSSKDQCQQRKWSFSPGTQAEDPFHHGPRRQSLDSSERLSPSGGWLRSCCCKPRC